MLAFKKGLLIAALFCASCISVVPPAPPDDGPYPQHAKSTRKAVIVYVQWYDSFAAVNTACLAVGAQPVPGENIVGCYEPHTSTIHAVEPINFNDKFRLEILGHEFWHSLGAMHP